MNDDARAVLSDIVRTEGRGITAEPRRLQALLSDRCGSLKLENNLLVSAADEGIPEALLRSSDTGPRSDTAERLARQLEETRGFEYSRSRWAVDSWAMALGLDPGSAPNYGAGVAPPPVAPPPLAGFGGSSQPPPIPPATPPWTPPPASPPWSQPTPFEQANPVVQPAPFEGMTVPRQPGLPPPPPPSGGNRKLLIGVGAAVGGIALIAILVVALSGGGGGNNTITTTVPRAVTTIPLPTTTISVPPTVPPLDPVIADLIARVPTSYRSTCKTLPDTDKRTDFRNIPGIVCDPNSTVSVFFYKLPNPTVMNDEYQSIVTAQNLSNNTCDPNRNSTFRGAGPYTTGSSERGKALCYVGTDMTAHMDWTDDALNTYGSIAANDSAAARQAMYQFWVDNGALNRLTS